MHHALSLSSPSTHWTSDGRINNKQRIVHRGCHKIRLTMSSSLHLRSSSRDILFSCFLKYFLLAACRLNHVYAKDFTCGSRASMNGWNSS